MKSLSIALLILSIPLFAACDKGGNNASAKSVKAGPPATPVILGEVTQGTVPIQISDIGTVEAYATVGVKAQVGGVLQEVHVKEGQEVKAGDLLFEIDPRPFQADLRQAEAELSRQKSLKNQSEANLARVHVQLKTASDELARNKELAGQGIISKNEYEKLAMAAGSLEANARAEDAAISSAEQAMRAAQAEIDSRKLQLGYTMLKSPIDGRLGDILVDEGNLVKANPGTVDQPLVVIHQIKPIQISFTMPERYLDRIRTRMAQGDITVDTQVAESTGESVHGKLTFMDNQVDRATGTIKLKATFENADGRLWPGQFVNVTLTLGEIKDAVLAPRRAVANGQNGDYAFVLGPESTVRVQRLETGEVVGDVVVVKEGLKAGDRVVLDGQLNLRNGARVTEKKELVEGKRGDAGKGGEGEKEKEEEKEKKENEAISNIKL